MPNFELRDALGNRFKVDREYLRVGRSEDNNVVIRDPAVSRYHLNFYIQNDQLIVEDAGSQNGFLVNGSPVRGAVILTVGDRVYFGSREYEVTQEGFYNTPQRGGSTTLGGISSTLKISVPTSGNRRVLVYGSAAAFLALVLMSNQKKEEVSRYPASNLDDFNASLNPEGYTGDRYVQRSLTDVQADGRFREALRDYNNENYSRALLGFQEALTLNANHESAAEYLEKTEVEIKKRLNDLLKDSQRSYQLMQYRRSKERALKVLTMLSDENANYGRKIAEEALSAQSTLSKNQGQEEILLKFPCKESREEKICNSALEIIRRSREKLGEEDVIK